MDTIFLSGKKELDIYINPQRQELLRRMRISGTPMTPKQLADQMDISASAVQHHIKKLIGLGIVALHHTAHIHGILASYYEVLPKTVSIGCQFDDINEVQRIAFMQNELNSVFSGIADYYKNDYKNIKPDEQHGDFLSGIVYLKNDEAKELYGIIRKFLDEHHQNKQENTVPWEYALIAYPITEETDA
ncbi:MAG TPA: helix-turn-helix domain-containing protein [Oscillospiraceae bacterium]|nr:helix-turn-helix domain-containing protein [Oscillospiraceae bacterium]HPF56756.1 helix-turn-helix domain-containing protein [Clostridiales bacterium]HPK35298.1 helix-turn-helix domain-containing protein [Oscillospiraceae bacterium]HPR76825.1 helix-turn-helix domain-containing protein [Oscillospiraceae bacterium]